MPLTNRFEALGKVSMSFKRNQVEQAISRLSKRTPSPELKTRLKRLLEADRKLEEGANYAFFSAEAPGTGTEVWFSEYEAFALLMALRLLEHGLPQSTAASILRRGRSQLEPKHAEIMKWDPSELFEVTTRQGKVGVLTKKPVFMVIGSRQDHRRQRKAENAREVEVVNDPMPLLRNRAGLSATLVELVKDAHDLRRALMNTTPSKRGRGSG